MQHLRLEILFHNIDGRVMWTTSGQSLFANFITLLAQAAFSQQLMLAAARAEWQLGLAHSGSELGAESGGEAGGGQGSGLGETGGLGDAADHAGIRQ